MRVRRTEVRVRAQHLRTEHANHVVLQQRICTQQFFGLTQWALEGSCRVRKRDPSCKQQTDRRITRFEHDQDVEHQNLRRDHLRLSNRVEFSWYVVLNTNKLWTDGGGRSWSYTLSLRKKNGRHGRCENKTFPYNRLCRHQRHKHVIISVMFESAHSSPNLHPARCVLGKCFASLFKSLQISLQ